MKSIIGIIGVLAISSMAHAEPDYELCGQMSDLAGKMMQARQMGVTLKEAMSTTDSDYLRSIVMQAWEVERWHTESLQQDAISDFSDVVFKECLYSTDDHTPK